ncbi:efflux RND transporter periplasmic adaptor subunit [Ulvibacterium marinum]|uniref:efflux RND transporter periplasmic adaptor subunit n=1 Tax=Ulvibacterium marinum TaxID=2419782 RepID=UPI002494A854|nr:efflux RND transporter periplasmic adaptor subunit [Ulvibacterium marinum]
MKRLLYTYPIILLLLNILACGERKNNTSSEVHTETPVDELVITREQFEENGMILSHMEEKTFPITVSTNGMIDVPPENRAVISAVMGGYITKTPLLVGDKVNKGQLLVTLENPEFIALQQEYLEVKEQLVYLKSEYERHRILFDEKISSQKNYLRTESEFKTARAQYKGLQKQLQLLNISPMEVENGNITGTATLYAPISGSVTKVLVSRGAYVSPSSPILEIVDNDHIHLELSVFEKDIMQVKKGQPILFRIPEASDNTFEAEVYLVGTTINENRTIQVHAHLKNEKENRFLTGMFVEADIVTDQLQTLALPSEAVVTIDDKAYVLLLVSENDGNYQFRKLEVQTGQTHGNYTAIGNVEKLDPNNRFLTKGAFGLIEE